MTQLVLLGLQLVLALVTYLKQNQAIDAGRDEEIAKAAAGILMQTAAAKAIMQKVTGMSDAEVDQALKELEP